MSRRRLLRVVLAAVLAGVLVLLAFVLHRVADMGGFNHPEPSGAPLLPSTTMEKIPLPAPAEDFEIAYRYLFLSCGGVLPEGQRGSQIVLHDPFSGFPSKSGLPEPPMELLGAPNDFHPHGISAATRPITVYSAPPSGLLYGASVFVVNHRKGSPPTIEQFRVVASSFDKVSLQHQRTLADPRLTFPNDVVALDEHRFFVTSNPDQKSLAQRLSIFAGIAEGNLLYYDGTRFHEVARLDFPNGIARFNDRLLVAETVGGTIAVFDGLDDPLSMSTEPDHRIDVATGIDNLTIGDDGYLYAAVHRNLFSLAAHRKDPSKRSPWAVYRLPVSALEPGQALPEKMSLWLEGTGAHISGVSVAGFWHGSYIFGSVGDPYLLRLTLKEPTPPAASAPGTPPE